jgi:hypothetical protein
MKPKSSTKTKRMTNPKVDRAKWFNRNGDVVSLRKVGTRSWLFDVDADLPWSFSGSPTHTTSIDPAGGPYIGVGMRLSDIHHTLPQHTIEKLEFGVYDTDASGYGYTGWLLHTS